MKKTTLFRVLTFVLLFGLLASCSKHTDKPANPDGGDNGGGDSGGGGTPPPTESYYVKMKTDGTAESFTGTVKAMRSVDDGTHILQIQGIKGGGSTDEVDLVLYSAADVAAGDYTEGEHDTYYILGVYAPQSRVDDSGIFFGGIHLDNTAPFKINITEMTSQYVKGTFSGTFYDDQGNGGNKKVISEGEFKAPIQ